MRFLAALLGALLCLFAADAAQAQTVTYRFVNVTGTPINANGVTTAAPVSITGSFDYNPALGAVAMCNGVSNINITVAAGPGAGWTPQLTYNTAPDCAYASDRGFFFFAGPSGRAGGVALFQINFPTPPAGNDAFNVSSLTNTQVATCDNTMGPCVQFFAPRVILSSGFGTGIISSLPPLSITPTTLAPHQSNSFSQPLTITGGNGTYTCTVSAGSLPAGLVQSGTGGCTISGIPTTTGSYSFTIVASDTAGSEGTRTFSGSVAEPVPTLSEWAMILFGLLLAGGAALYIQRRQLIA
ncbi:Ig domain-containing protein [Brevundimonas sp.]|uniref:Ig domain-containing protein n=1 Tax=Brevundimonas sp. TaxID=1871086 RepID=UPI00261451CA|nr:Ig domain-containing protein [Brevundimonas sp.]